MLATRGAGEGQGRGGWPEVACLFSATAPPSVQSLVHCRGPGCGREQNGHEDSPWCSRAWA